MTWKTRLVLLFAKLRKPLHNDSNNIALLRKKSEKAVKIGYQLFDKKVTVANIINTNADGVPVRIYKDSDASNQPVIVYYHGGGFVLYGLDSHDNVCRRLCMMNRCLVVSVAYRLAPEHTFPAAHEDAFTALQWVKKNITSYGGNSNKLIVAGDSAGGNLAACMAHRCKKANITLKAQILIYPWIDGKLNNPSIDRYQKGYMLDKTNLVWFQQQYTPRPEDRCHPSVSPAYETDFYGLPPAFILTAEYDPLLDDGKKYYEQLRQAGNRAAYKEYKNLIHGFLNIPYIDKGGIQAYYDIQQFLKNILTDGLTDFVVSE
jgi:acetyl esterase